MMKTKIKLTVLVCLILLSCSLMLASCGGVKSLFQSHVHAYGEWKTLSAATCTADGQAERTCECGEVEKKTLEKLGHAEQTLDAVEPTCTDNGLTEGKGCATCHAVLEAQEIVPAAGHAYDQKTYVCKTCQASLTQIANRNDFVAYDGTRDAVIFLDKCFDASKAEHRTLTIAPGMTHLRLVGTAGTNYNIAIAVDGSCDKPVTVDLVDVTLASEEKAPVIHSNSTQQLSVVFYGSECGVLAKKGDYGKAASLLNFSMNGEKGGNGEIAIRTIGALRLVVAAESVEIRGGSGGTGGRGMDAAPSPQSGGNGGNGGNGAQAIEASSIDVYCEKGYNEESIAIKGGFGGEGGEGGDGFLWGKKGSDGKFGTSATPTNVSPTYHK